MGMAVWPDETFQFTESNKQLLMHPPLVTMEPHLIPLSMPSEKPS